MESKLLSAIPQLVFGFSTKADGSMLIQDVASLPNRQRLFQHLGIPVERTAAIVGVHGTRVQQVPVSEARPLLFQRTDGLYTLDPSRVLTVTGADCFPIYVVDPINRVTGLCHAGWRGVVAGILPELLGEMIKKLHCKVQDLCVVIGPGIRACHFEVKMDVWSEVAEENRIKRDGKTFVDLPRILVNQAMEYGLRAEQIEDTGICTVCSERYFSYRRDKPQALQAQMAYLGWKL
jgi:YfiH family protein